MQPPGSGSGEKVRDDEAIPGVKSGFLHLQSNHYPWIDTGGVLAILATSSPPAPTVLRHTL